MNKKKTKTDSTPKKEAETTPAFTGISNDFKAFDEQDALCAKKNDGTD